MPHKPGHKKEKPIVEKGKGEPRVFIEKAGEQFALPRVEAAELARRGKLRPGETLEAQAEERRQADLEIKEEERVTGIREELGSEEAEAELQRKIDIPIALPGKPLTAEQIEAGEIPLLSNENIKAAVETTILAFSPLFPPLIAALPTATAIAIGIKTAVGGVGVGLGTILIGSAVSIAGVIGLGKLTDLERKDLDVMEATLTEIESWGSSVESTVGKSTNPQAAFDAFRSLNQMAEDINFAESQLQQKANANIVFKSSQEWFEAQTKLRKTRQNLLERMEAVESLALYGRISGLPEELMVEMDELTEQQKRIKPDIEKYS